MAFGSPQIKKLLLFLWLCGSSLSASEEFVLANKDIRLHIIQPDSGYYTGARFESAGFISHLIYRGNDFFGRNYMGKRDPAAPDQICGQAEEFSDPIFLNKKGRFLKIGNGVFEGPPEKKYWVNDDTYSRISRFPWNVTRTETGITFRQTSGNWDGYAYEYTKTIRLTDKPGTVKISYMLRNTGEKIIETKQYAHNFFALNESIPAGTQLVYRGKLTIRPKAPNPPYQQNGNTLCFRTLKNSFSYVYLPPEENQVTVVYPNGMTLSCIEDYLPCERGFYTGKNHICPESFISIQLRSGEKKEWNRQYVLTFDAQKRNTTNKN